MMYVATCHEALPITTLNSPVFDARLSIRCVYGRIARQAETPENLRANRPPSLLAHRDGGSRRAEAGTAAFTESPVSGLVEGKSKKIASYDRRGSPQRRQNMPQWQPLLSLFGCYALGLHSALYAIIHHPKPTDSK